MSDAAAQESERLRQRNEALRMQVLRVREFIASLQGLVSVTDEPRGDEAAMEALSLSLEHALRAVDASGAALLVLDEDSNELVFVVCHGAVQKAQLAWRREPAGRGIAGWVLQKGEAAIVNDVAADDRYSPELDQELGLVTRSVLAVPVIGRDRVLGVIELRNKEGSGLFGSDDQTLVSLMSRFAGELLYRMANP